MGSHFRFFRIIFAVKASVTAVSSSSSLSQADLRRILPLYYETMPVQPSFPR